jgi:hypothetical protein
MLQGVLTRPALYSAALPCAALPLPAQQSSVLLSHAAGRVAVWRVCDCGRWSGAAGGGQRWRYHCGDQLQGVCAGSGTDDVSPPLCSCYMYLQHMVCMWPAPFICRTQTVLSPIS